LQKNYSDKNVGAAVPQAVPLPLHKGGFVMLNESEASPDLFSLPTDDTLGGQRDFSLRAE